MARYIDADRIVYWIRYVSSNGLESDVRKIAFSDEIARMPTADVVEVVRCKDCIHRDKNEVCEKFRQRYPFFSEDDFYCGFGARKTY